MNKPRAAMLTMKQKEIEGTLYINGQVIFGKCRFIVPEFAANSEEANTQRKREQLLIDRALEENPDLVLTRAGKLYDQEDKATADD